ncbi:MAG TPA: hypothetical protein VM848_12230 [Acidimicrobiia bacterium]|nr:hypothetical protein [Acidimicrobiia bacterium]
MLEAGDRILRLGDSSGIFSTPVRGQLIEILLKEGDTATSGQRVCAVRVAASAGRHFALTLSYEAGMGVTLWARDADAFERWGSYVDPRSLSISSDLASDLERLAFLTSIGWQRSVPGQEDEIAPDETDYSWREQTPTEEEEAARLQATLLARLREQLGPGYSISPNSGMDLAIEA